MSDTFEIIERVGISNHSITEAVEKVVKEANEEKKVGWFEVIEQRGRVTNEGSLEFQIKVRIGRKYK
ncbi:MAG: dodecin domain-containing protein [Melioribacteraceae bacterium]|nr:dodecin domain-containing protein [Melioribacteraceae bacterium]MCF8265028.1 dodecin domain-containing protein [Melioribacteraceae bacterium]MCF8413809.1 dodecin domain-containing protein [Melioribacteraceae bacterium]